uniref:Uncharacterized protein n=1 Tax=Anguilla anguilla TaxID=7936 RepID=A0A0E9UD50_ANGAN
MRMIWQSVHSNALVYKRSDRHHNMHCALYYCLAAQSCSWLCLRVCTYLFPEVSVKHHIPRKVSSESH